MVSLEHSRSNLVMNSWSLSSQSCPLVLHGALNSLLLSRREKGLAQQCSKAQTVMTQPKRLSYYLFFFSFSFLLIKKLLDARDGTT